MLLSDGNLDPTLRRVAALAAAALPGGVVADVAIDIVTEARTPHDPRT